MNATAVTPITVALVEDSAPFRTRLKDFINASPDLLCTCTYATGGAALRGLPAENPAVVLMDLQLPDMSGIECTFQLKSTLPGTEFMIFTVHEDGEAIFRALQSGASGYLLKRTPPAEILAAIRELHRGGSPMSSEIARKVVQSFRAPPPRAAKPALEGLSPRQEEILRLLAQGLSVKEIAEQTGLTVETVRSYLKLVYQKLHVRSRTEALLKYLG
jgi:DNA-binding NarL/FixJ family response regulator